MSSAIIGSGLVASGIASGLADDGQMYDDYVDTVSLVLPLEDLVLGSFDRIYVASGSATGRGKDLRLLLDLAFAERPKLVVLCSSLAVYGRAKSWCVLCRPMPSSDYGKMKLGVERLFAGLVMKHGVPGLILRLPGIFGPPEFRGGFLQAAVRENDLCGLTTYGQECLCSREAGLSIVSASVPDASHHLAVRNVVGRHISTQGGVASLFEQVPRLRPPRLCEGSGQCQFCRSVPR